jgi:predicted nucleic acid-binding protein
MENRRLVAVVSDAGPLIHLSQIGKLFLLKKLFGVVLVTEKIKVEVLDEGLRLGCVDAQVVGEALGDGWLRVEPVSERLVGSALKLAEGENISRADAETLLLAVEKKTALLVDERLLSDLAKMYKLRVWSTWTVLLESLAKDYLVLDEVEGAVEELGNRKFRLSSKQSEEILGAAKFIEKQKVKLS